MHQWWFEPASVIKRSASRALHERFMTNIDLTCCGGLTDGSWNVAFTHSRTFTNVRALMCTHKSSNSRSCSTYCWKRRIIMRRHQSLEEPSRFFGYNWSTISSTLPPVYCQQIAILVFLLQGNLLWWFTTAAAYHAVGCRCSCFPDCVCLDAGVSDILGVSRMTEVTIREQMMRMTSRAMAIPFQFLCGGALPTRSWRTTPAMTRTVRQIHTYECKKL